MEESAPAAETPAVEVGSDIQARLDAGEEVMVGYAVNTLSNPALKQTIDNVAGFLEELGCTVSVAACEGDTTLMKAVNAGIPVIFNGQYPGYADQVSGGGATDYAELGTQNANAAIFKQIYDSMIKVLEGDSRITISYTGTEHNSIDLGYSAAEEALTMDPDIRVFLCYQDSPGIGVANYLISRSDLNMDEFGVFNGSYSDTSAQMVGDASNPTRSIIYYGVYNSDAEVVMGYNIFYAAKSVMLGEVETPFWILDDMWSKDDFGFNLLIDHPENDTIYE